MVLPFLLALLAIGDPARIAFFLEKFKARAVIGEFAIEVIDCKPQVLRNRLLSCYNSRCLAHNGDSVADSLLDVKG